MSIPRPRPPPQTSYENSPAPIRSSKAVESAPREDPTVPPDAYVNAPLPADPGSKRSTLPGDAKTNAQPKANAAAADSPPQPPVPANQNDAQGKATSKAATDAEKKAAAAKAADPSKTKADPADQSNPTDLQLAPVDTDKETIRRDSQRPTYARVRRADRRNVLIGTVETNDGEARGEVPVSVTNRNNGLLQHNGVSNAFGGFAIRVPDGQWAVKVTMPSGNIQTVRNITVTDGKVMDNVEGKEVYNLIISY